jgi:hypothetical protein
MGQITDYSSLKTEIASTIDRTDLTDDIPRFIQLAEFRINQDPKFKIREMETRSNMSTIADQDYYTLPEGYIGARALKITSTTPEQDLKYLTPEQFDKISIKRRWGVTTGRPRYYTISGDELRLGPTPESVHTVEVLYYKKITPLSETNTSNWFITDAPNLIFYGALMEAEAFIKNDARIPLWKSGFDLALQDIVTSNSVDRHSGGAMHVSPESPVI